MEGSNTYWWTEIAGVPQKPGVYAWYYLPELTDFDLQDTIKRIIEYRDNENKDAAIETVEIFLDKFLFKYFREEPYKVSLYGPLKPKYEGSIEHKPELSGSLIDRIVEDPERLITIKQVLEKSAPDFASPIYIGMSDNLGSRLKRHKKLIEKYSSRESSTSFSVDPGPYSVENRDESFAMRVCSRSIPPTRLFVAINILENAEKRYVDIENILNRIHYPLLGRN